MTTSCGAKQSIFFGGGIFCPHCFWVLFFTLLGERFWDKNYLAHDIIFVKELFFPHKLQSFLFGKASFLGNGFEVLNQSLKRFQTKVSPKCFCRNFFFFSSRASHTVEVFLRLIFPMNWLWTKDGGKVFKQECENNATRGFKLFQRKTAHMFKGSFFLWNRTHALWS